MLGIHNLLFGWTIKESDESEFFNILLHNLFINISSNNERDDI